MTLLKEIPEARSVNFSLLFENDESEYTVLNKDDLCLRVAVLSSKTIQGTDIRRLKLKLFEGSSPTRRSTEKDNADGRRHAMSKLVKKLVVLQAYQQKNHVHP